MADAKNGNGKRQPFAMGDFHKETIGLGLAEVVSGAVSLGVVAYADDILPGVNKEISKVVAKTVILPHLDAIEKSSRFCKLKDCQPDLTQPREERAEKIAHTMLLFGEAWVASMVTKIATRQFSNKSLKVEHPPEPRTGKWWHDNVVYRGSMSKHDWSVILWDEGVHLGAFILGNIGLAKQTDKVIDGLGELLQSTLGWSKDRAHKVASMFMIWEVPNIAGFAAGVKKIHTHHANKNL